MPSAFSMLTTSRPAGLGLLINDSFSSSNGYIGTIVDHGNDIVNDIGNDYGDSDCT